MNQILNAQNVCFSYYKKPLCLKDVNLTLNENEKAILFASEESGKTTFLKVLSSFEDKYFGKILYRGKDLKSLSDKEKSFSLIFAEPIFIKGNIRKNIDFLTDTLGVSKISKEKLQELLELFKIECDEQVNVKRLSILDKRKLALLRSYIKNPDILFVDDIFCDLEKDSAYDLFEIFKVIVNKLTVVFACGSYSYKMLSNEICKTKFDKALYLNAANYYKYDSVKEFLDSKVDFMSLSFREDWQSDLAVVSRTNDGYYLLFDENNRFKLDKKLYDKLDTLKLDIGDDEDVYFVYDEDFDISLIKNDEINKFLQNGKFSVFAQLDGSRIL